MMGLGENRRIFLERGNCFCQDLRIGKIGQNPSVFRRWCVKE